MKTGFDVFWDVLFDWSLHDGRSKELKRLINTYALWEIERLVRDPKQARSFPSGEIRGHKCDLFIIDDIEKDR